MLLMKFFISVKRRGSDFDEPSMANTISIGPTLPAKYIQGLLSKETFMTTRGHDDDDDGNDVDHGGDDDDDDDNDNDNDNDNDKNN